MDWLDVVQGEARRLARRHGGAGAGAARPDPARIARAMDVGVIQRPDVAGAYRTCRKGKHLIIHPPYDRPERRAYVIAHELGEIHLLTVEGFRPSEDGPDMGPEVQFERGMHQQQVHEAAVWFAMFLLVPECDELAAFDPHVHELADLKAAFPLASHEVLAVRIAQRTEGRVTITDNGQLTRRTAFGPWSAFRSDWHPTERRVHEAVAADGRTSRLTADGLRVAGFPIFEPAVRRIILLSHFDEAYQEEA
jgi:hypothetical protein